MKIIHSFIKTGWTTKDRFQSLRNLDLEGNHAIVVTEEWRESFVKWMFASRGFWATKKESYVFVMLNSRKSKFQLCGLQMGFSLRWRF